MRTMKVSRGQKEVLQLLSRRDISVLRKNPALVAASRDLVAACRKIIRKVQAIPEFSSRKTRATAYRRIVAMAEKALEKAKR